MTTAERVVEIINHVLGQTTLLPETDLSALGVDSLDTVTILVSLEEEWDIDLPDQDVKLTTVQEYIDLVVLTVNNKQDAVQ